MPIPTWHFGGWTMEENLREKNIHTVAVHFFHTESWKRLAPMHLLCIIRHAHVVWFRMVYSTPLYSTKNVEFRLRSNLAKNLVFSTHIFINNNVFDSIQFYLLRRKRTHVVLTHFSHADCVQPVRNKYFSWHSWKECFLCTTTRKEVFIHLIPGTPRVNKVLETVK